MNRIIVCLFALLQINAAFAADTDILGIQKALQMKKAAQASEVSTTASPAEAHDGLVAEIAPDVPQAKDYAANEASNVFGAKLFTGAFAHRQTSQYNPDYVIGVGDSIQIKFWGAFDLTSTFTVDPKGNIFLPHIGPVNLIGVRNQELQARVDEAIRRVYRANVFTYANLAAAQPVRIFVSGFVNRPGLYAGTSMDSLLHFLDQAGGIDPERGSFLKVQVKRRTQIRAEISLYDFLLKGNIPLVQLADGDVILVTPRRNTVLVSGLVENANRFEFAGTAFSVADLATIAKPQAAATHVRVTRNTGTTRNVEYYPLTEASSVTLGNGDELAFTADKKPGTITVRVEGEHMSAQEYVLPYGAHMGDLLGQITFSERSERESLQLFRQSVKARQKDMLMTSLTSLETAALTARSGTSDEAILRKTEADMLLRWIEKAKAIEPKGQVLIADATSLDTMLLENGDVIHVPTKDDIVLISGEVLFPNAVAYNARFDLDDYISRAGGLTQNGNAARIVVAHVDGSFDTKKISARSIRPGDEILVLPKIDVKSREIAKDLTQILYQIAIAAKVAIGL